MLLKELLCPPEALEGALAAVCAAVPGRSYTVRLPAGGAALLGLNPLAFGMAKWYDPIAAKRWAAAPAPYLGLAFD